MKIAERLILITNDIKNSYAIKYGDISSWDFPTQDMYLLNCDAEILNFLRKYNITIHEEAYSIGITFGIRLIMREVRKSFFRDYGPDLDYSIKCKIHEEIQERVYNYIINGEKDAY